MTTSIEQRVVNQEFENAKFIEITRNTVRFGTSVYQFKNVTGFKVGRIPKNPFLFRYGAGAAAIGFIISPSQEQIGSIFICVGVFAMLVYALIPQQQSFILYLNSGHERAFVSTDRNFLMQVVSTVYRFMEEEKLESLKIDMSRNTMNINGELTGIAVIGDKNRIS